ncbi:peroxiredoxin [Aureococcus anophagefferens]|nr:peroxiredoxin [Aureococcus anophagefferens]
MAAHLAMQAARRAAPAARRFIATGDAAAASGLSLQRARPWLNGDGPAGSDSSNQASDHAVALGDIFAGKRVAHVPGYAALAGDFEAKGVAVVCFSVACPYAMRGWQQAMGVDETAMTFLADDLGAVTAAWGVAKDYSGTSLGPRSERFSMLVDDGTVKAFTIVDDAAADAAWLLSKC